MTAITKYAVTIRSELLEYVTVFASSDCQAKDIARMANSINNPNLRLLERCIHEVSIVSEQPQFELTDNESNNHA